MVAARRSLRNFSFTKESTAVSDDFKDSLAPPGNCRWPAFVLNALPSPHSVSTALPAASISVSSSEVS